jgi:hypothetical protein
LIAMKLPTAVRERFRQHGRTGGLTRAARMTPEARTAVARRAATARWLRRRFGASTFATLGFPGGDLVDAGLVELAQGRVTIGSLLVSLAAPRLAREGIPLSPVLDNPEEKLYALISRTGDGLAHARYNAYLRQVSSFADACRQWRLDRGSDAS